MKRRRLRFRGFKWPGRATLRGLVTKRNGAILAVLLVLVGFAAVGLTRLRTDTTPASFLPQGDPTIQSLDTAADSFGADPIVMLLENPQPRELLSPENLPKLVGVEGQLASLPDVAVVFGPGTVINQVAGSAKDLLATISGKRDAIKNAAEAQARSTGAPPEAVAQQARQAVSTFDQRYGALLVQGLPAGLPTLRNPSFVNAVVFDDVGLPRSQMRFIVPNQNSVALLIRPRAGLDQAGTERLVNSARDVMARSGLPAQRLTVTGTPVVAADLGSTVEREIPILGGLAVGLIAACFGAVPWIRRRRHRLLPLAATLGATTLVLATFGWLDRALSLGVVAFLPILIGIGSDFPAYAIHGARRRLVVVAGLASAASFASLAISPMPFVRDLGLALAAGVVVALGVGLVFRRYVVRPTTGPPEALDDDVPGSPPPGPSSSSWPLRHRIGALIGVAAVAAVGWIALPDLHIQARPDQLAVGLPSVDDALHAEDVLGSSGEVQILLTGDNIATPQALAWMRQAQDATVLQYGSSLRPIVSPPDLLGFLGDSPTPEQVSAALGLVPQYLSSAVVRADAKQAVMSFGIRLQSIEDQKKLLDGVQGSLPVTPPGMHASVVGLPVAAVRGFELISADRYLTNLAGIVAAGLVLALGLRRRSDAGRAVLAALLATGWSLALAWVLGLDLSPLSVALGSLTTATACEFTLFLDQGGARRRRRVVRTVVVAASAACLGYLSLAASGLAVIREFGLLLAATVLLSLAAASTVVALLPARAAGSPTPGDEESDLPARVAQASST